MPKTIKEQANDEARAVATMINGYASRIDQACEIAYQHVGDYEPNRRIAHQTWVIDQMIRALQGDKYDQWIIDATNDGAEDWDTGIVP